MAKLETDKQRDDRFSRIELMLGSEACERLARAHVTVFGLGAVGSYAVEGLARAGVGRLRLIDFDRVSITNINRQLYAMDSTLGRPKCEVARERVLDINPACRVETVVTFADSQTIPEILAEGPDVVIDAIDGLNPKVELLSAARTARLPLVSCLGAALRFDPTRIRVGRLDEVTNCPLGRSVRSRLRRRGAPVDFPCVYSDEPLPRPLPIAAPTDELGEEHLLKRGRTRNTLGSMPTITGMFGLTAANLAIGMIVGRIGVPDYAVT